MNILPLLAPLLFIGAAPAAAAHLEHRFYLSPAEIRSVDTRELGRRLVRKIREECDLPGAPPAGPRLEGAQIIVMVSSSAVESILAYGLLNQHLTQTSNGIYPVPSRFMTEQELAMTALPYGFQGRQLLPKYGILNVAKGGFGSFKLPTRYGSVALVLKASVADRVTWTYADSMDFSQRTGLFQQGGEANPVLPHSLSYRRKEADRNQCGNYCEAQIWGEVTAEDVDYVMIKASEAFPASLLDAKLPVYAYSVSRGSPAEPGAGQAADIRRGALLVAGTSARSRPVVRGEPASAAIKSYLEAEKLSRSNDADLARAFEAETGLPARMRLIGEIAAARKTPLLMRELETAFHSKDESIRALALYGLGERSWAEFKPHALEGLGDDSWIVDVEAIALSSEHAEEPEIKSRLNALRTKADAHLYDPGSHGLEIKEWLGRLTKAHFCE